MTTASRPSTAARIVAVLAVGLMMPGAYVGGYLWLGEIGVSRLVWGGHEPSLSYSTELSKVLDSDLTHDRGCRSLAGICGGSLGRSFATRNIICEDAKYLALRS